MGRPPHKEQYTVGKQWLLGSGAIAILAFGGIALYSKAFQANQEAIAVQVISVEQGDVEVTINESGILLFGNQQTLTSPVEGAVEEVLVQPGERVEAGQVLITLRNPERQTALVEQQLAIAQQQAELDRSQRRIAEAEEQFTADQAQLENLESLAEEGIVPFREVQQQANQVRDARAALRDAQKDADVAALTLNSLQVEQQRIQAEIDDSVITAPIGGVILSVEVKNGDGIDRRTNLLTLGNPAEEIIELQLSTLNAAQVQLGQTARISVIGPDSEIFEGRVVQIDPQAISPSTEATNTGQSTQPTVRTLVKLNQPSRKLIPGSQVNVEIVLDQHQNAIALDISAIQNMNADPFVWLVDSENRVQQRSVEIGLEGLVSVEILSGLVPGDRVALPTVEHPLSSGLVITPTDQPVPSESVIPE
jgi:HlyD family secretion protein